MVIFNSYVKLAEGICLKKVGLSTGWLNFQRVVAAQSWQQNQWTAKKRRDMGLETPLSKFLALDAI